MLFIKRDPESAPAKGAETNSRAKMDKSIIAGGSRSHVISPGKSHSRVTKNLNLVSSSTLKASKRFPSSW